jgi:transposase
MRTGVTVYLSPTDRKRLQAIVDDRNSPQKHVWRARIVLATADGLGTATIMRTAGVSKTAVWRWQERFISEGVDGLLRDKTRPARIARLTDDVAERIVALTLGEDHPLDWSGDGQGRGRQPDLGSAYLAGSRPSPAPDPHLQPFQRSEVRRQGPHIVGLYVDPPAHAVALSVDEKSQIQALDRTQPGLPLKKGRAGTMTHDYKRNGTTTLFAAFDVLEGKVIGRCMQRHRHQEFIRFLNAVEREVPAGKTVHAILDNYATHKHPKVIEWLGRHPRWSFHFTPTSASWLNAVEGFFAILTKRRLKRGVFKGVVDLQAAINRFVADHNQQPKPFVWTADPDKIIAAANRGHQVLDSIH